MLKLLGHIVPVGDELWMLSSAAEAGFRVRDATKVLLRLKADNTVNQPETEILRPRYAVHLDGETILDARMSAPEETVTVFEETEKRDAEVRLVKLSECTQSVMALAGIETDGTVEALPEKALKIEFIGDSITCGYGVEGKSENEDFTTATENAEKAYGCLTAKALDADAVLTCFSGHGLVSGYTDDPQVRHDQDLVQYFYEKEGRNCFRLPCGKLPEEIDRSFAAFRPAYIVLNLGTNDMSWCVRDPERGQMFAEAYTGFLKTIRKHNPDARILCTLGIMGTDLNDRMRQGAEAYCRETGDTQVRILPLEDQNAARDGYGSNFHPNETTQRLLAERVTEELRKWMEA